MTSAETKAKIKKYEKESREGMYLAVAGVFVSLLFSSLIGILLIILGLCYFFIRGHEASKMK